MSIAPTKPKVVRKLQVIAGPDAGKVYELPELGTVLLGRDKEKTLTKFTERKVSRTHCRLEISGNRVLLTNDSLSGTLVNDQLVLQHELKSGDSIRLGEESETKIVFEVEDEDATLRGGKPVDIFAEAHRALLGKTVGHFQVVKLVDCSPSGTTFRARDTIYNRDVALKVLMPDPSLPQRLRMMHSVVGIQHPNLVTLYEAGEADAGYWVAQEYVEGSNLEQLLERSGPTGRINWDQVLGFAIDVVKGLEALHQKNIVHRSITPRAILLARSDSEAKLGGLWRARLLQDCKADKADTQDVLRHVQYMPPERAGFGKTATAVGDLYSLGTVLYHLLTGRPPFTGDSDKEIIAKIVQTDPLPLRKFQLSLPEALEQAVLRLLAKRPEERYQSALELLTELQRIAEGRIGQGDSGNRLWGGGGSQEGKSEEGHLIEGPFKPPLTPSSVAIPVTCQCGQVLQARKQFAGTKVRCPWCKGFLILPGRPSLTETSHAASHMSHSRLAAVWKPQQQPPQPSPQSGSFLRECGRYLLLVGLLVLTLVISLSGMVCDRQSPSSDKPKESPPAQQEQNPRPQPSP
ncbi:MAG TPA: FHA domain-containing serine/threonine-protein kinase [Gemmataceae bacterium]|nr:FHA domain-containing serine/threonine-protein kinase [Gemmataceae bacterium]